MAWVTLGVAGVVGRVADGLTCGALAGAKGEEPDMNVEAVSGMQTSNSNTFRTSSANRAHGSGGDCGTGGGAEAEPNGTVCAALAGPPEGIPHAGHVGAAAARSAPQYAQCLSAAIAAPSLRPRCRTGR